jgi:hypothetical protein
MNLAPAIRTALLNEASIAENISIWNGAPSIHTRRPIPSNVEFPLIVISPDISFTDRDFIANKKNHVLRDVTVVGQQPDHYRLIEQLAYNIRELFHRNRFSLIIPDWEIYQIIAFGPIPAPTDDESMVARLVTLNIDAQPV